MATRRYNTKKFLGLVNGGASIKAAAMSAGVPLSRALRGRAGLPAPLLEAWKADSKKRFGELIEKGQTLTAGQQENLARGTLVDAAVNGELKRGSVRAAELLGKDRRVNMFQADAATGVVIIQPPPGLMERLAASLAPVIEGEETKTISDPA